MGHQTMVLAEDGRLDILITREFDLPLGLLFKAYEDPAIVEQWMGTSVIAMESKTYGSYQLETKDRQGKVQFRANGVFHTFLPNRKITRTFEMDNTPFGVQLEFYEFEALSDDTSKLRMHVIYESVAQRDQLIQFGMTQGINMAHNRLQDIVGKLR